MPIAKDVVTRELKRKIASGDLVVVNHKSSIVGVRDVEYVEDTKGRPGVKCHFTDVDGEEVAYILWLHLPSGRQLIDQVPVLHKFAELEELSNYLEMNGTSKDYEMFYLKLQLLLFTGAKVTFEIIDGKLHLLLS